MGSVASPVIPKTMKAAQFDPKQQKIVVNEIPVPKPGKNEFLVKIRSASLCHSDLMNMDHPALDIPVTPGHEGVGYIVQIDPSTEGKGFKVGDPVGFLYFRDVCMECEGCKIHQLHCTNGKKLLNGFNTDGFFQEYAVVDYRNAAYLDEKVWNLRVAAPVFCAGITTFHSLDSCGLEPGQWVGIIGCGGLGQMATQYAKAMGLKVVGIDVADKNLEETRKLGADAVFNSRTTADYDAQIKALTGGGVHAAVVYTDVAAAFNNAPRVIRLGGALMVIGIPKENIQLSAMDLVLGRYRVLADSTSIASRMQKAVDFTGKHGIMPNVDIRPGLESLPAMVDEMRRGVATKRTAVVFD
ncbi:uncharacterized protein E0L32_010812 [Thyridium curvatum]|uniref:Enoyl reductase (ER) domain-containing protein n=1 Tax=Thyridium curvatum TaxID=1093900 RepID=A0A507AQQ3_9PEZI|nr:uncharacterized protein E0L32_010812 [Thyridium curvatum]TPX07218.1 hypothetical protein E0L32_010812 [Thyridium curvatum]